MMEFRLKIIGGIKKGLVCFILFIFLLSYGGCKEKIQVVVNKPQTEIETEKFTGINEKYDSGGILVSRISYKDGLKHGDYWLYHDNGTVRIHGVCNYDKRHGEIFTYYHDGQLLDRAIYDNGVCLKDIVYRDGKVYQMRDIQKKIEYRYNGEGEVVSERFYGEDKE